MLRTLLKKHQLLCLAFVAAFAMTACGSKKDVIGAPPPKPAPEKPVPGPDNKGGENQDFPGGGLPDPYDGQPPDQDSDDGGQYPRPKPRPKPYPKPNPSEPTDPYEPADPGDAYDPSEPSYPRNPKPNHPPKVEVDPNPYEEDSLGSRSEKCLTGGETNDGYVFTSSSTDCIHEFLRKRNTVPRVSEETRQLNLEAAAAVQFAQFSVDRMSDDAMVTLKIRENRDVKIYNLSGSIVPDSKATSLRKVKVANGFESTGKEQISGTLKCLDLDGGCENIFVRLKYGTSPYASIINVIFRSSMADIDFELPGKNSNNREYLKIQKLVFNTVKRNNQSDNIVKWGRMHSWEVVNGRAGVTVSILTAENEFLGFAGPLLAPEAGTGVNFPLQRLRSLNEEDAGLMKSRSVELNLANYIGDARLVANNGLGQVRIALKMRQRANYEPELFKVTFSRNIKPIIEVTDENLK